MTALATSEVIQQAKWAGVQAVTREGKGGGSDGNSRTAVAVIALTAGLTVVLDHLAGSPTPEIEIQALRREMQR